jgi:hypothetical protein
MFSGSQINVYLKMATIQKEELKAPVKTNNLVALSDPKLFTDTGISLEGLPMTESEADANLIWKVKLSADFSQVVQKVRYTSFLFSI